MFTLNGLPGKSRVHDRLPLYPPVPTDRSMPPFTVCGLGDIVVLILQSFQAVILIRQSFQAVSGRLTIREAIACTRRTTLALMFCGASGTNVEVCGSGCSGFAYS